MQTSLSRAVVPLALVAATLAGAAAASPGRARHNGFFRSHCALSHTANDDPILMPNKPGMSMLHEFFGNASTTAASTAASLRRDRTTTCRAPADAAAYWVPTLYQDGTRIVPKAITVYYRQARRPNGSVQPLPVGLQMIAGNETAMEPQSTSVAYWNCGAKAGLMPSAMPPSSCPAGTTLVLTLVFPDCWDGRTLAGATQRNVVYDVRGACPAGHPVAIPQLRLHVHYPIATGSGLTLSMGPGVAGSVTTAHADFVNGWSQNTLATLVRACVDRGRKCGTVGPDNRPLGVHKVG
jgi:hypothetical protein